ncbi:hypothetical protein N7499_003482 [Penicillium canescens]|uniref:Uncharacterized protein n=1 Tax=Penicillium canescens TaxID=5083 RepID=A0AAD6I8W0_PENCN|nr:uncharacterized protein N7446_012406 [Penicillium canescens]KAJ6038142.1 hypothetical protein N7460_007913 [Penicillium canescens]KAJ6045542.1 hypothetical protein N7446_012406 [Penicillium canescens]KAJ6090768.1 hypothetical protein N7499_003482 [Penicillium canescens]
MRLRYDVTRLSLFRALSNLRTRVPLARLLSPIPRLDAVAQTDQVSHLFAKPFASYSCLGELRIGTSNAVMVLAAHLNNSFGCALVFSKGGPLILDVF